MEDPFPTLFAPGKRVPRFEALEKSRAVVNDEIVDAILKAVDGHALILNEHRQVLAANIELIDALNLTDFNSLVGLRPGEIMRCIHADEGPSGCGTSRHCRACGAVIAMLSALDSGKPVRGECTLSVNRDGMLHCPHYSVYAVPVTIMGDKCLEFVLHDITDAKMKELMERLFLHDLRNALTGALGWSELLKETGESETTDHVVRAMRMLSEMVEAQACVASAEKGELKPAIARDPLSRILDEASESVSGAPYAAGKKLDVLKPADADYIMIQTDSTLLNRVLVNMLKNAFEAAGPGEAVVLSYSKGPSGGHRLTVRNPGFMPEEVQLRVFQRAFSTKGGSGRGLGTYSMKLIGEGCLKGKVGFTTSEAEGTGFFIDLPVEGAV